MPGGRSYWLFRHAVPMDPSKTMEQLVPVGRSRGKAKEKAGPAQASAGGRVPVTDREEVRRAAKRAHAAAMRKLREADQRAWDLAMKPAPVDVAALRCRLGMSRVRLARAIGVPVGTLRHWERGDRTPRGAALVLLNLLDRNSQATLQALAPRARRPRPT